MEDKDYSRVSLVRDDDGHWYCIPYNMTDQFHAELAYASRYWEDPSLWQKDEYQKPKFSDNFEKYSVGGCISGLELYKK